MFKRGRKVVDQVKSMFDKPSTSLKNSRYLLSLGKIEETDQLGTALHKEATIGNIKTLKKVLFTDICVDYPNDLGQTPLFCACARNNESTALLLLHWRANPNERSLDGMTPCHATSYMGNVILLGKLIEAGGDLRLHDHKGNSVRDWATQNWDSRTRAKMLEFIDKIYVYAMAYSCNTFSSDMATKYSDRPYKQNSVMEIMMMKTGSDLKFDNLERVQSTGFGNVYLGNDRNGGILSVVPLVNEGAMLVTDEKKYNTGFYSYIEKMQWLNETVSVKQVIPDAGIQDGIDLLIADAEFLGKLRHPNILLLMGICQSAYLDKMMLVFEYVENATLHFLLHKTTKHIALQDNVAIMHQVCAAMCFIHNQNLMHCGLSSMAVYLVSPHRTKVGNFEFMVESIKADLGKPSHVSVVSHGEFLYNWMSPELIQGLAPHYSSDVYSYCCIMWEIFARQVPWTSLNPKQIRQKVVDDKTQLNIDLPKIPLKLKGILGYGLELREECRLNKFEYINEWLKLNQQPKFQRINFIQPMKNKSENFADQLYTFSSASSCSSESHFNLPEKWTQDKLDFNRDDSHLDLDNSFDDAHFSSSNFSFNEMDGANPVSVCDNCESSQGPVFTHKLSEEFHISPSVGAAHTDYSLKSLRNRKCPSESDLEHQQNPQYLQPIKPASHLRCLNPGDPLPLGNDGYQFQLFERNNSGRPSSWDRDISQSREYTSQPHLGHTDERSGMARSKENVRRLADLYQLHFNQHKLRQAILKGSMAPRGSCPDLETSSDSICGMSACNRKFAGDKVQSCSDIQNLTFKKSQTKVCLLPPIETTAYTCGTSNLKSSTPKDRLLSTEVEQQPASVSTDSDSQKIFYTLKDLACGHGETGNNDGNSHTRSMFLQEVRTVQQKLVSKSFGRDIAESSFGVCYNSPNIETYSPDVRGKQYHLLSMCKSPDMDTPQKETDKALTFSSRHCRSQSIVPSPSKARIRNLSQVLPGMAESFRTLNYEIQKLETSNHDLKKKAVNFHFDKADFVEKMIPVLGMEESSANSLKIFNSGFIYQVGDHFKNQHDQINSRTSQDMVSAFSLHKAKSKQAICSADEVDAGHSECSDVLNGTFTVAYEDETADLVSSHIMDSGEGSTLNTSVDSDRIGQWIDSELYKIKEKMRLKSSKLVSDHGTESSGSFHGLKDISPVSTLGEDEEKAITSLDVYTLGSQDNADLPMSMCSEQNNKTESAKMSIEVGGSCDFEFHEFYIDDDLDSAEQIQQDIHCSKVSNLDSNTSTRHTSDANDVVTSTAGSVKKKAEYFLHLMNNVKPPVFPKKLKRPEKTFQENLSYSTLSVNNLEQGEDKIARGNVIDKDTLLKKNEALCSSERMHIKSKGVRISRNVGVLVKPRTVTSTASLQNESRPSFSLSTGDKKSTCEFKQEDDVLCQFDRDTVLSGDFEKSAMAMKKDLKDDKFQETVSDTHELASESEACRVNKTEELCINVGKTVDYNHSTDANQTQTIEKNYMKAVNDGSDSNSDQWLRNKVISIQEKIRSRRARINYSVSSEANSDNDDNQYHRPQVGTKGISNSDDFDTATNCKAEDYENSLNPESVRTLQNGEETVMKFCKCKPKNKEKKPGCHDFSTDENCCWDESQENGSLATKLHLKKKEHRGSSSYLGQKHNSSLFPPTSLKDNCEDTTVAKKCLLKDMESFSLQDFNSLAVPRKKSRSSLKMSVHHTDTSMTNKEDKGTFESTSQSGVSQNKWTPWKSQNKNKEPSSHDCKILPQECNKKSHRSILRRPISLTKEAKVKGVSNLIPSPVQPSRSKFSVGHDSKLPDKVISFQGIAENEIEKSNLKRESKSSKQDKLFNEERSQREESFDIFEYDNKFVKTWLEQENFTECGSLASFRQADHQSITSRVMEVQNMSTRLVDMPCEFSISMTGLQAENSSHNQSKSSLTAKKSPSQESEKRNHHHSSLFKESLSPICKDSTCVIRENAKENLTEISYTQDGQFFRANACQSLSKLARQKSSLDQYQHSTVTPPLNQNIDHCLTLDLRTPNNEHSKGKHLFKFQELKSGKPPCGLLTTALPTSPLAVRVESTFENNDDLNDPVVVRSFASVSSTASLYTAASSSGEQSPFTKSPVKRKSECSTNRLWSIC